MLPRSNAVSRRCSVARPANAHLRMKNSGTAFSSTTSLKDCVARHAISTGMSTSTFCRVTSVSKLHNKFHCLTKSEAKQFPNMRCDVSGTPPILIKRGDLPIALAQATTPVVPNDQTERRSLPIPASTRILNGQPAANKTQSYKPQSTRCRMV